jgi:hypothetical protein
VLHLNCGEKMTCDVGELIESKNAERSLYASVRENG